MAPAQDVVPGFSNGLCPTDPLSSGHLWTVEEGQVLRSHRHFSRANVRPSAPTVMSGAGVVAWLGPCTPASCHVVRLRLDRPLSATLTLRQVRTTAPFDSGEIRDATGDPASRPATSMGVGPGRCSDLVRGDLWRHLAAVRLQGHSRVRGEHLDLRCRSHGRALASSEHSSARMRSAISGVPSKRAPISVAASP